MIPAAGLGTRLQSALPKPLVPVAGRPMLHRLLDLYRSYVQRVVVVVHPSFAGQMADAVRGVEPPVELLEQPSPTGMLDAILLAGGAVRASAVGHVWITWCDQVAVRPATVGRLAEIGSANPRAGLVMPTVRRRHPYVHLQRDAAQRIVRVLHHREGDAMPEEGESDMGLFSLSREAFLDRLGEFAEAPEAGAATGERNFLPFIPWIAARDTVLTFPAVEEIEAVGVNTPEELRLIEEHLRARETGERA